MTSRKEAQALIGELRDAVLYMEDELAAELSRNAIEAGIDAYTAIT